MPATVISGGTHPSSHARLVAWVDDIVSLCQPDQVHWCDGSQDEYDRLCAEMVAILRTWLGSKTALSSVVSMRKMPVRLTIGRIRSK